jgi:hypothetical protein
MRMTERTGMTVSRRGEVIVIIVLQERKGESRILFLREVEMR